MCKVLIIPKIKNEKAVQFAISMGKAMSPGNMDGLGYAAIDEQGNLFGERWLNNIEAFIKPVEPKVHPTIKSISDCLEGFASKNISDVYSSFGESPDISKAVALTLHTRMATSAKGIINTHPFYDEAEDTSLIHNGVIYNDSKFDKKLSTCDSESILISYLNNRVDLDPKNSQKMANDLSGYYACGVFSRDNDGNRILDVFKGNHASLYAFVVEELDTVVFTTQATDASKVCAELGLTMSEPHRVKEGMLMRFNPLTGEHWSTTKFNVGPSHYSRNYHSPTTYTGSIYDATKKSYTEDEVARMREPFNVSLNSREETLELLRSIRDAAS